MMDTSSSDSRARSASFSSVELSALEERFQRQLCILSETGENYADLDNAKLDGITQEDLDALRAKDMYELTKPERENVLQDIHGVTGETPESPGNTAEQCKNLRSELGRIVQQRRTTDLSSSVEAYQLALCQNPSYVQSAENLLPFLRADLWDETRAAERLLAFYETKKQLFGDRMLTKDIKISDLSKEDKKSLESGFIQLLPVRDVAGRAIISIMNALQQYQTMENLNRAFYYMVMTALQDVQTQKSGLVIVGYNVGPRRTVDRKASWAIQLLRKSLPVRVTGEHCCYDDSKTRPNMTIAMLAMGAASRVRFRAHFGSTKEVCYELLTYGIPSNALPITNDGEPKHKSHRSWLKLRRRQEDVRTSTLKPGETRPTTVVVPGRVDVLLGRGKPIQEHVGNLRYHSLLEYYQNAYEGAKKFDKMQIAQTIVSTVHGYGGQFLKQQGAGWVVVDDLISRDKVSHAFRTLRTSSTQNSVATASSTVRSSSSSSSNTNLAVMNKKSPKRPRGHNTNDLPAPVPSSTTQASTNAALSDSDAILENDSTNTVTDTDQDGSELSGWEEEESLSRSGKSVKGWEDVDASSSGKSVKGWEDVDASSSGKSVKGWGDVDASSSSGPRMD